MTVVKKKKEKKGFEVVEGSPRQRGEVHPSVAFGNENDEETSFTTFDGHKRREKKGMELSFLC